MVSKQREQQVQRPDRGTVGTDSWPSGRPALAQVAPAPPRGGVELRLPQSVSQVRCLPAASSNQLDPRAGSALLGRPGRAPEGLRAEEFKPSRCM